MTTNAETEVVPAAMQEEYLRLRREDLAQSKSYYFREILPRLRQGIESDPDHVMFRERGCDLLISLMGGSPETTVVMALVLRPKKLVVVYCERSDMMNAALPALDYLRDEGIVKPFHLHHVSVNPHDPDDIYCEIQRTLPSEPNRIIDVTGGTKIMSSTAGALAWEHNIDIAYLDSGWDPRAGSAVLSRPGRVRVLRNPSRRRGYEVRRAGIRLYEEGNFVAARSHFEESQLLIDDSFFDLLALRLCTCYHAMAHLDGPGLRDGVRQLKEASNIGGVSRLDVDHHLQLGKHIDALQKLAGGDRLTRIAAFFELAKSYRTQHRHDFSSLLSYRAMECLVEYGIQRRCPEFRTDRPEYELLGDRAAIEQRFTELTKGGGLPERVAFMDGLRLLCILDEVHKRIPRVQSESDAFNWAIKYASRRNRSTLAHGYDTLKGDDSKFLLDGAMVLATAVLRAEEMAEFDQRRSALRHRDLPAVDDRR